MAAWTLLATEHIDDLGTRWALGHFKWAGHLARLKPDKKPLSIVALWRFLTEWKAMQAIGTHADSANRQAWRHRRRGKQHHWDHWLHDILGMRWEALAQDRDDWDSRADHFTTRLLYALARTTAIARGSAALPDARLQASGPALPYKGIS